ncbi:GNAT family N-acetyltransferase [Streptomyces graminilatus]|uniref:GNAT family N-acetyltransferase n=1 Tax=Streptomyces graminilatus TaxID=1464070 RepID=UPI0006E38ED0|nr:GNAT family N-acetyltransferase [Streptomyces graminilatus]
MLSSIPPDFPAPAAVVLAEHPSTAIDELAPLWGELLAHHVASAPHLGDLGEVRSAAESWQIRRAEYRAWLEEPQSKILTVSAGDRLLGYAFVRIVPAAGSWKLGDHVGVLETLVVAAEARGRGLGRRLIEAVDAHCHAHGATTVRISVIEGNDAHAFYTRWGAVGFTRTLLLPLPLASATPADAPSLSTEALGHEHLKDRFLERLQARAELAFREGAFERADALYTHVLNALTESGTARGLPYLKVLHGHALVAYGQGRWADGEARLREVVAGREELAGPTAAETIGAMARLAEAVGEQGRWEEAETVAREAIRRAEAGLEPTHEETLSARLALAWVLERTGAPNTEEVLRPVTEALARALGSRHRTTLASQHLLVQLLRDQERYDEALDVARELAAARGETLGPEHPHTLRALADLAVLLYRAGRGPEAVALARETVAASALITSLLGADGHHDRQIRSACAEITTGV